MDRRKASELQGSSRIVKIVSLNWAVAPVISVMHRVIAILFMSAVADPGFAQTIRRHEPLYLAPDEVAYVDSALCGAGMALKVTGSMRNLPRKKLCVPSTLEQASLLGGDPMARAR
jgi:hypothetical protein